MVRIHVGQPPAQARMAFEQPIEAISEADLMALVSLAGTDARAIEFRPGLPGEDAAAKVDFLAEAASFANTNGGLILYGATPRSNFSPIINGLDHDQAHAAAASLEQLAWSGIAPRLPGLLVKIIVVDNHKCVLLVRIPQTFTGPHMVTFQQVNTFYSRNPMGKYLLTVDELRSAFSVGETLREKMRAFRLERAQAITKGGLSIQLPPLVPRIILHILPVLAFRSNFRLELDQTVMEQAVKAAPMQARGLVSHYNYDGLITFSSIEKYAYSYVQFFRNACLEAGESLLLQAKEGRKFIPSVVFEREIIQCGERLLASLKHLRINPPYVVMLSFLGVRGYSMMVTSMRWQSTSHHIERDNLYLDEIILEGETRDFARALRPIFDQVWNSCGWPKSLNYDEQGNWHEGVH